MEYRATVRMRIQLVKSDGTILWQDRDIARFDDYRASHDIYESESAKKAALAKIVGIMMADVHDRIFDGF